MAIVDKIKSDIQFRNKVIGGAIVFVFVMVGGIAGILAMNNSDRVEEQEQVQSSAMAERGDCTKRKGRG